MEKLTIKKPEFTKGQWHIAKNGSGSTCIWVGASLIANIREFPHEGSEANAKLIAAAPELYEALVDLMAFVVKHVDVADCQEYNHAHRVIMKVVK